MSGRGRDTLTDDRGWSGGPRGFAGVVGGTPGCPAEVEIPSWMTGSGREALKDVQERSGGLPECPGVVSRPSRMTGSGR